MMFIIVNSQLNYLSASFVTLMSLVPIYTMIILIIVIQ